MALLRLNTQLLHALLFWMNDAAEYLSALSATYGGLAIFGGGQGELDG